MVHNFTDSLKRSHAHAEAAWWAQVYGAAFPSLAASVNVRGDGYWQRGGIDRVLTLNTGRTITVDEKVREKDYGDILLEQWSDLAGRKAGWVQKPLACDFIAYAIAPTCVCYLLPTLTLQRSWRQCGRDWVTRYGTVIAANTSHETQSVPVPVDVLLHAMQNAMCIRWTQT